MRRTRAQCLARTGLARELPGKKPSKINRLSKENPSLMSKIRHRGSKCYCFDSQGPHKSLETYRLDHLHPQSRQLIRSWFEKALEQEHIGPENSFEPFVFSWFSVNAWAACVTGEDQDSRYMQRLISDSDLQAEFENLLNQNETFRTHANAFAECWPIFKVKNIRDQRVSIQAKGNRQQAVSHYLATGATEFQPQCWNAHQERNEPCPIDWPHTIAAIYRVRCNLFHGEKHAHSEMDQNVVHAAFRVLLSFFQGAQLL